MLAFLHTCITHIYMQCIIETINSMTMHALLLLLLLECQTFEVNAKRKKTSVQNSTVQNSVCYIAYENVLKNLFCVTSPNLGISGRLT